MKSTLRLFRITGFILADVMALGLLGFLPMTQAAEQSDIRPTVQEGKIKGSTEATGDIQERGVSKISPRPPYHCSPEAGVCLCVGAANCEQMTRPTPCKRQKFCPGQASTPNQSSLSGNQPQESMGRTSAGTLVICSCRSGP